MPAERRIFDAEEAREPRAGRQVVLLRDDTLSVNASFFVSRMRDQQVRTSFQLDPGDPTSFVFFTDQRSEGANARLRSGSALDRLTMHWEVYANVGLLKTEFEDFQTAAEVDLTRPCAGPRASLTRSRLVPAMAITANGLFDARGYQRARRVLL